MNEYLDKIHSIAKYVEEKCGRAEIGLVLGSGLGDYVEDLKDAVCLPYRDIPAFPVSTAPGHAGCWWCGELYGKKVYMMQGRFHFYEGYQLDTVTMYVRVMKLLGVKTLILTNAAGGVNRSFADGTLMAITDHINLSGHNPLIGHNIDEFGPRFPDMSTTYTPELIDLAMQVAAEKGIDLKKGVYTWMNGPSYETPAEIRMVAAIGGDAVGMSTAPEAIVARHCGMKVIGISCITNMAAGIQNKALDEQEVLEVGRRVKGTFRSLIDGIIERL